MQRSTVVLPVPAAPVRLVHIWTCLSNLVHASTVSSARCCPALSAIGGRTLASGRGALASSKKSSSNSRTEPPFYRVTLMLGRASSNRIAYAINGSDLLKCFEHRLREGD